MTTYLLRGAHANEYELQNYYPLAKKYDIRVVSSQKTLTPIKLPTIKLWSPADLPNFPFKKQILNRLIGGEQWLIGLENLISKNFDNSNHRSIVHSAETYTPYTHQVVQLRKKGVIKKLICTCWETIPHNNEKFARLREWKREAYRYVDIFHTPTERARTALIKEGVDGRKIKVIPYGVDTSKFYPKHHKLSKKPIILTIARKVPEKGYKLWLKLAAELGGQFDFRWVDSAPYQDMPRIFQQADLFFFPSLATPTWEEQYGMALVEAMACGLPVVASNTGAIPEIIGNAGLLFDPLVPGKLQKALEKMLNNTKVYIDMSKNSIKVATSSYDSKNTSKNLSLLYVK